MAARQRLSEMGSMFNLRWIVRVLGPPRTVDRDCRAQSHLLPSARPRCNREVKGGTNV